MPEQKDEQSPREQREQQERRRRDRWGKMQDLSDVLGLDPDFVRAVQDQGDEAIINRAEAIDTTGVHGLVQSMSQSYGEAIQDWIMEQDRQPNSQERLRIINKIAQQHGVPRDLATGLIGAIEEHAKGAMSAIRRRQAEEEMELQSEAEMGKHHNA